MKVSPSNKCFAIYGIYLPVQFPDESRNVLSLQMSLVHTLGGAPRKLSEPLQVKQCAGLTGLEQLPQDS